MSDSRYALGVCNHELLIMSSKRSVFLMAILLVLVLSYVFRTPLEGFFGIGQYSNVERPLAGQNSLSGLEVHQDAEGKWIASFDYFYTGEPLGASIDLILPKSDDIATETPRPFSMNAGTRPLERGAHHVQTEIKRPTNDMRAMVTRQVIAQMTMGKTVIAKQNLSKLIEWPDWPTWSTDQDLAGKPQDEVLKRAVGLIEGSNTAVDQSNLKLAKRILERLLSKNPQFDAAYVQLARIAMASKWGPEGLSQAEDLLASALRIQPESADAKILLGYVYSHQKRYKEAEALFVDVEKAGTDNHWLWANWGELLAAQGRTPQSIEKYRDVLKQPRTDSKNDRARLRSYEALIALLDRGNDLNGMDALYQQRAEEFGQAACYTIDQAFFLVTRRGDPAAAIPLARRALDANICSDQAREALGLAYYLTWSKTSGQEGTDALNQAKTYLPIGPKAIYMLASREHTLAALRQLIKGGESVEQLDNNKLNALAYALSENNLLAVRHLIKLGARTDALVGPENMPVALIPVFEINVEAIHLLQKLGVNYSKLRFRGMTAIEMAQSSGDQRLVEIFNRKAQAL